MRERTALGQEKCVKKIFPRASAKQMHMEENQRETFLGPSETARETTFTLDGENRSSSFKQYFTGFSEGSASWLVNKSRCFFKIDKAEPSVLHFIQKECAFGTVSQYSHTWRYVCTHPAHIEKLILLFNGNLLSPRSRDRFSSWCKEKRIMQLERQTFSPKSHWLAGYIDARGTLHWGKAGEITGFSIDEKQGCVLLHHIRDFLQSGNVRPLGKKSWRLDCNRESSLRILVQYLTGKSQLHPQEKQSRP